MCVCLLGEAPYWEDKQRRCKTYGNMAKHMYMVYGIWLFVAKPHICMYVYGVYVYLCIYMYIYEYYDDIFYIVYVYMMDECCVVCYAVTT
jgi:hypothetical protein